MSCKVETIVYALHRLNNSVNGNPRYRVQTSNGPFITSSDHSFVIGLLNDWRDKQSRPAVLTLTRSGLIEDLEYTD
jgi:hypothetical protein